MPSFAKSWSCPGRRSACRRRPRHRVMSSPSPLSMSSLSPLVSQATDAASSWPARRTALPSSPNRQSRPAAPTRWSAFQAAAESRRGLPRHRGSRCQRGQNVIVAAAAKEPVDVEAAIEESQPPALRGRIVAVISLARRRCAAGLVVAFLAADHVWARPSKRWSLPRPPSKTSCVGLPSCLRLRSLAVRRRTGCPRRRHRRADLRRPRHRSYRGHQDHGRCRGRLGSYHCHRHHTVCRRQRPPLMISLSASPDAVGAAAPSSLSAPSPPIRVSSPPPCQLIIASTPIQQVTAVPADQSVAPNLHAARLYGGRDNRAIGRNTRLQAYAIVAFSRVVRRNSYGGPRWHKMLLICAERLDRKPGPYLPIFAAPALR